MKRAAPAASVVWAPRRNFCPTVLPRGSRTSEYAPSASQCHTSTTTPGSGAQASPRSAETLNASWSTAPGRTSPLAGSERMSDRTRRSSTKYGPSVCSGRTTQAGAGAAEACRAMRPDPAIPSRATTSLRVSKRPTGVSSDLMGFSLPGLFQKQVDVVGVDEVGRRPAVEIVLGHAPLGEVAEALGGAAAVGHLPGDEPHGLGGARIISLVELVAAAELRAHRVPQQLHELDACHGVGAVGATQILVEIGPQ